MDLRVKVIGCGGIGGHLIRALCHFLHAERRSAHVVLVDGDSYEARNHSRMRFSALGNKAHVMARELAVVFGDLLTIEPIPEYVTPANLGAIIEDGDVVLLAVDNHATRHLIDQHCAQLDDIAVISGGNDGVDDSHTGTYGNVQIVHRVEGRQLTNTLSRFHPEILTPTDRLPNELSCEDLALASAPQLLFMNLAVASAMLNAFYALLHGGITYEEVYLDILKNRVVPVRRAVAG